MNGMEKIKIYHNSRCSKSNIALNTLKENYEDIEVINYLETPLSISELTEIIAQLGIAPFDLVRQTEGIYKTLYKGKILSDEEWIEVMQLHPKLIQRPIVVKDGKAVIARSEEELDKVL